MNIIGNSAQNTTIQLGIAVVFGEAKSHFVELLTHIKELLQENDLLDRLQLIGSDRSRAFLNALDDVLPLVPSVICQWHMNQDNLNKAYKLGGNHCQVWSDEKQQYIESQ